MNTDAGDGKREAGLKLMNTIIPDIKSWVATSK
jgi:hypothetical protein